MRKGFDVKRILTVFLVLFVLPVSIFSADDATVRGPQDSSALPEMTDTVHPAENAEVPLIRVGSKIVSANHLAVLLARDAGPARIADLVDNLVGERLVYEYGEKNGFSVSDEEINRFIDEAIGGESYRLLAQLFGEEATRDLIRQRLIVEKVVEEKKKELITQKNLTVSDKEIQDYYLENLKDMVKPEAVRFQYLVLQEEKKASEALTALRNGRKIEELWKQYSLESDYDTKQAMSKPELVRLFGASFTEQLLKLNLDEWSRLNLGRYIFIVRIMEKSPAVEPKLDEVSEDIRALLLERKVAPFMREWFEEIRKMYPVTTDVPFFRSVLFGEKGIELPETLSEPEPTSGENP